MPVWHILLGTGTEYRTCLHCSKASLCPWSSFYPRPRGTTAKLETTKIIWAVCCGKDGNIHASTSWTLRVLTSFAESIGAKRTTTACLSCPGTPVATTLTTSTSRSTETAHQADKLGVDVNKKLVLATVEGKGYSAAPPCQPTASTPPVLTNTLLLVYLSSLGIALLTLDFAWLCLSSYVVTQYIHRIPPFSSSSDVLFLSLCLLFPLHRL